MISRNAGFKRRQFLKKSLMGAQIAGIGALGMSDSVLAANPCTDTPGNYSNVNEVWSLPGYDSENNYDCDHPTNPYDKVEHGTGMIYLGSCWDGNSWDHEFHTTSHAEHFSREYCGSSWERSAGLVQQKATIKNETPSSISVPAPRGEMVKANPPVGTSNSPSDLMDYAFTGAIIALGGYNFWAGAAAGIIATYVNNLGNQTTPDPNTIVNDWDYNSPSHNCAGHYIQTEIEGNGNGSGSDFEFDQIHEAWGRYPNYTNIHYRISVNDPTCSVGCDCSGAPSSRDFSDFQPDDADDGRNVSVVSSGSQVTERYLLRPLHVGR